MLLHPSSLCLLVSRKNPLTTVIKLITRKCCFHPTEVEISLPHFKTFLKRVEQEQGDWSAVKELLRDVESVILKADRSMVVHDVLDKVSDSNSLLGLLLHPKPTSLSLIFDDLEFYVPKSEGIIDAIYGPLNYCH